MSPAAATAGNPVASDSGLKELISGDQLAADLSELEGLPFSDPVGALAPAVEAEQAGEGLGRADLQMWARLVRADAISRLGDLAGGGRIAHEVNHWAAVHGHLHLLARSHRLLSWFFHHLGDDAAHLEHAVRAVACVDENTSLQTRCDLMVTLATALGATGSQAESQSRFQLAEEMAVSLGDVPLQICVLNNSSYRAYWAGETRAAMDTAEKMLGLAAKHGVSLELTELETVARAQMGLQRYADAELTLSNIPVAAGNRRGTEGDEVALALYTLAETQRLLGATDRARATLDRCMALCEERGLVEVRVRVLQERAELLALAGAYRQAYELHQVFHAEAQALLSVEGDVRARTLQAVFETAEARRDSVRFREMSLHDPLTGLYNRRYVDERLDTLLKEAATTGAHLSIGLVDLDYFKLVNDTMSHAVGDEVLKQVAALLAGAVTEPAFVARLGGEEFLLVLPGCSPHEALARCEAASQRIRSHAWSRLTGEIAVTASIGVSSVTAGGSAASALLADADRNLYAAKRAGRDRVVAHPA